MNNATNEKERRFNLLLDNYAVAVHMSNQLLNSGLLERKIKVGYDVDRIDKITRQLVPALAIDLRTAQRNIEALKDPTFARGDYISSSLNIANAYFDELATKGPEWEYSDLEDLFIEYKKAAEDEMEDERERW